MKKALILFLVAAIAVCSCSCSTAALAQTGALESHASPRNTKSAAPKSTVSMTKGFGLDTVLKELPDDFPMFTKGVYDQDYSVKYDAAGYFSYDLRFESVTKEDVVNYQGELEKAGFDVTVITKEQTYTVQAKLMDAENIRYILSISVDTLFGNSVMSMTLYELP
jgi:hypothetical protein